jgi:ABC-2 type transport system permease protein
MMEAWFKQMRTQFTDPAAIDEALAQVESADLPAETRVLLGGFLPQVRTFIHRMNEQVDADGDGAEDGAAAGGAMQGVRIEKDDLEFGPRNASPANSFEIAFPQSVLWALIGCSASFAISIVNERKQGTLLRLRIAPLTRGHIVAGKALACFLACVSVTVMLLAFGAVVFNVRISNPAALAAAIVASGACFVGLMMFISVLGKTEQAVAGAGWAIMLVLAMFGGGMVPAFAMPEWMTPIARFSPVWWCGMSIEGAIWRNLDFAAMAKCCGVLVAVGIAGFGAGVTILRRQDA